MKLELNVVRMTNEDVIATSGSITYTISGLGDGEANNATFVGTLPNGVNTKFKPSTQSGYSYSTLVCKDDEANKDNYGDYNGTYTWNPTSSRFEKD